MKKNIVIIGAGISGLSLLYFLRKKYAGRPEINILLLEKNDRAAGPIRTIQDNGCLFECGPNGFLANQPVTLQLIDELGLSSQVISADLSSKKRFLWISGQLHAAPMHPYDLFSFKPMRLREKLRVCAEVFVRCGKSPNESVHHFVKRRFGAKAARYFADPVVSGIYAGHSEHLSVQAAFPKMYEFEQAYGSVLRGLIASLKSQRRGLLQSFRDGMGSFMQTLTQAIKDSIRLGEPVKDILRADPYYLVVTDQDKYAADEVFVCTPAYVAGDLLGRLHSDLGVSLRSIDYAPLAVIGLVFDRSSLSKTPEGFGFLAAVDHRNPVLGAVIDTNVFAGRAPSGKILLRVMIGGVRYPQCVNQSKDELTKKAITQIDRCYGIKAPPESTFFVSYAHAIPQYETAYVTLKSRMQKGLQTLPRIHLLANYLNGVSFNDCIANAQQTAARLEI